MLKIAVFVSGGGTDLQSVIDLLKITASMVKLQSLFLIVRMHMDLNVQDRQELKLL